MKPIDDVKARVQRIKEARRKGREEYIEALDATYPRVIKKHREDVYIDDLEALVDAEPREGDG